MFKLGDKVEHTQGHGVIVYGPFEGISGYEPRYLVRKDNGKHFTGGESYLKPVPKFEVGQVVRTRSDGFLYRIVAGPFRREGNPMYVLVDPDGNHKVGYEDTMTPVVE